MVETVKMSSKGQVIIPQGIRENIKAVSGTVFVVIGSRDTVVLKKISTPSKSEILVSLKKLAKTSKQRLRKMGFIERDLRGK